MELNTNKEQTGKVEEKQSVGYLSFFIGNEVFGINLNNVTEIIGVQPITHLPEVPHYIKGIINLRGKVIPVIDMRLKFNKEPIPYNDRTCVIVIEVEDLTVGLIVDSVSEVLSVEEGQIVPPPEHSSMGNKNQYIFGIGVMENQVILMLDCDKLLQEEIVVEDKSDH